MDVRETVEALAMAGVRVHCLALGGDDLSSSAGKMTMQVLAAIAEFERDLLIERTQKGVTRARADGTLRSSCCLERRAAGRSHSAAQGG